MGYEEAVSEENKELEGVRLYKPGAVAAYLALAGIPVGLFLYGVNILRRGQRWLGRGLCVLSGVAYVMLVTSAMVGGRVLGLGALGLPVAILVYKMERNPYRDAVQRGTTPAKWWPPLFWVLGIIVVIALIAALLAPEDFSDAP
jgi:hypothetical protein